MLKLWKGVSTFLIKDEFVNMYLIKDSLGYIAIDAGKDLMVIETELHKLNIKPEEVIAVFLTHSDMDHVAGIPLFKNAKDQWSVRGCWVAA